MEVIDDATAHSFLFFIVRFTGEGKVTIVELKLMEAALIVCKIFLTTNVTKSLLFVLRRSKIQIVQR